MYHNTNRERGDPSGIGSIYGRAAEHAANLALIHAASLDVAGVRHVGLKGMDTKIRSMIRTKVAEIRVGDIVHGLGVVEHIEPQAKEYRKPKKIKFWIVSVDHPYVRNATEIIQTIQAPVAPGDPR